MDIFIFFHSRLKYSRLTAEFTSFFAPLTLDKNATILDVTTDMDPARPMQIEHFCRFESLALITIPSSWEQLVTMGVTMLQEIFGRSLMMMYIW